MMMLQFYVNGKEEKKAEGEEGTIQGRKEGRKDKKQESNTGKKGRAE